MEFQSISGVAVNRTTPSALVRECLSVCISRSSILNTLETTPVEQPLALSRKNEAIFRETCTSNTYHSVVGAVLGDAQVVLSFGSVSTSLLYVIRRFSPSWQLPVHVWACLQKKSGVLVMIDGLASAKSGGKSVPREGYIDFQDRII